MSQAKNWKARNQRCGRTAQAIATLKLVKNTSVTVDSFMPRM